MKVIPISVRGGPINRTTKYINIAYFMILMFLLALTVFSYLLSDAQRQQEASAERRYTSYLLADELRQSSDDLTRFARLFVTTGEEKYETMYWQVLSIRNGEMERPIHYERVYWDLVTDPGEWPRESDAAESLEDLMRRTGITNDELALLQRAQSKSDELVAFEQIALNMVKGLYMDEKGHFTIEHEPDMVTARELMFGEEYMSLKASIMKPIESFQEMVDERTIEEENVILDNISFYFMTIQVLIAVLILVVAWLFWLKRIDTEEKVSEAIKIQKLSKQAKIERIRAEAAVEMYEQSTLHMAKLEDSKKELEEAHEKAKVLATHDYLTGLPNRVLLEDRIKQGSIEARRNKKTLALMMMDIDKFKELNDTFGHDFGDRILVVFAHRLREFVRELDTVARFGGDEFILVDLASKNIDSTKHFAERLHRDLDRTFVIDGTKIEIRFSIGIAFYPTDTSDLKELMVYADKALYEAKKKGNTQVCYSDIRRRHK